MVVLSNQEATELRERLRQDPLTQPTEESIAVSVNASTSVTFTQAEKAVLVQVLTAWPRDADSGELGKGLAELRDALSEEL